jgi:hypothetical protein
VAYTVLPHHMAVVRQLIFGPDPSRRRIDWLRAQGSAGLASPLMRLGTHHREPPAPASMFKSDLGWVGAGGTSHEQRR